MLINMDVLVSRDETMNVFTGFWNFVDFNDTFMEIFLMLMQLTIGFKYAVRSMLSRCLGLDKFSRSFFEFVEIDKA